MRPAKIRIASLAAQKYVYLAKRFNAQAKSLKKGVKYKFYDGVLFKTTANKFSVTTNMVALPVFALALNITSRDTDDFINGRAAHVRDVDLVKLSRDAFYANGENVDDLSTASDGVPATIPEAFAFGASMPEGTPSVVYTGFTGKRSEGYVTLRSDRAFDTLTTSFPAENQPFVSPSDKFWVDVVLATGGDNFRRFTFSEAWLRQYAPGHDLISRAHRNRITVHYIAACSNGRRLALTVPMTAAGVYDEITNNYSWGAYNALTLCIDMDAEDGPEVLWSSLWDRRSDGDLRTGPYAYWAESPFNSDDYSRPPESGYNQNTIVDALEMTPDGTVFGGRIISTQIKLPEYETDPDAIKYQEDLILHPFGGQKSLFVEWTPEGSYSEGVVSQMCEAGLYFYNKLDAETGLPAGIKNTVLSFLLAYGVQNTNLSPNGISVGTMYRATDIGVGYTGDSRYIFVLGLLVYKDGGVDNGVPIDLTGRKNIVSNDSTQYAVVEKLNGAFAAATWFSAGTGFESVGSRSTRAVIVGFDRDGFTGFFNVQNIRIPRPAFLGSGLFAVPATDTAVTNTLSMLLAFLSFSDASTYTKNIPGVDNINSTVGDESVRVIQEALPDAPSMLALTDDSGAYISNDGGDNWIRAITSERYRDLAYVGNKFLVRPFRKDEPIK